jgi:antitoxin component of RelBE/YafQ-DinJ toxin-antitoxin module
MATQKQQNDAILAVRINKDLLEQVNALAKTKAIGTSSLVRMLLSDYLRNEAPKALLSSTPQQPVKGKYVNALDAMSPAERKAYQDEWDY